MYVCVCSAYRLAPPNGTIIVYDICCIKYKTIYTDYCTNIGKFQFLLHGRNTRKDIVELNRSDNKLCLKRYHLVY